MTLKIFTHTYMDTYSFSTYRRLAVWWIQMGEQCCKKTAQERTSHKEDLFHCRHAKWSLSWIREALIWTHSLKRLCAHPLPWKWNCRLWIHPWKQQTPLRPAVYSHLTISASEYRKWVYFVNYSKGVQKEHHQPNSNIPSTSSTGTELSASRKHTKQEAKGAENITWLSVQPSRDCTRHARVCPQDRNLLRYAMCMWTQSNPRWIWQLRSSSCTLPLLSSCPMTQPFSLEISMCWYSPFATPSSRSHPSSLLHSWFTNKNSSTATSNCFKRLSSVSLALTKQNTP